MAKKRKTGRLHVGTSNIVVPGVFIKSPCRRHSRDGQQKFLRFHGPKGDYHDSYSDEFPAQRSKHITQLMRSEKDVLLYFNNTIGSVFQNAVLLRKFVNELSEPLFA